MFQRQGQGTIKVGYHLAITVLGSVENSRTVWARVKAEMGSSFVGVSRH